MRVEYFARRAVRILGHDYAPGDQIADPNIPGHVLGSLMNTRRISQRVTHGEAPAEPQDGEVPTVAADTTPEPDDGATEAQTGAVQTDDQIAWKRAWIASGDPSVSLRQFLIARAELENLSASGSIAELIARLAKHGVAPDGSDG